MKSWKGKFPKYEVKLWTGDTVVEQSALETGINSDQHSLLDVWSISCSISIHSSILYFMMRSSFLLFLIISSFSLCIIVQTKHWVRPQLEWALNNSTFLFVGYLWHNYKNISRKWRTTRKLLNISGWPTHLTVKQPWVTLIKPVQICI